MKTINRAGIICIAAATIFSFSSVCSAAEWKETENGMTYISDSGKAVTGLQEIDGKTYYFNSKGIMKKGWMTAKSGAKYYFNSDGSMRTGWLKLKSGRYYFSDKGVMQTGAVKIGRDHYCFDDEGVMLTGWQDDYYYGTNGKRAVNKTVIIDGEKVKFDKNGRVKEESPKENDSSKEKESTSSDVTEEKIIPEKIEVTDTEFTVSKGAKFRLSYQFRPITANCTDVTFKSSSPSVVFVNSKGDIEAMKKGTAYVTIKSTENPNAYVKLKITVKE
ncbi:MAG: Ig-like domain-containing protein [Oscillospiraceae bacterium]|nr:Ig-like domain-containing protein [Oscillospiraceae bacterium]